MSIIKNILKDTVVPEEKNRLGDHSYSDIENYGRNKSRQYTLDHLEEAERRIVEEIKDMPSRCRRCEKLGTNNYGECECSYEDKGFIKKTDIINHLTQNNVDHKN